MDASDDEIARLQIIIDELRQMRSKREPRDRSNPEYHALLSGALENVQKVLIRQLGRCCFRWSACLCLG
jgi:hypothetical protein